MQFWILSWVLAWQSGDRDPGVDAAGAPAKLHGTGDKRHYGRSLAKSSDGVAIINTLGGEANEDINTLGGEADEDKTRGDSNGIKIDGGILSHGVQPLNPTDDACPFRHPTAADMIVAYSTKKGKN